MAKGRNEIVTLTKIRGFDNFDKTQFRPRRNLVKQQQDQRLKQTDHEFLSSTFRKVSSQRTVVQRMLPLETPARVFADVERFELVETSGHVVWDAYVHGWVGRPVSHRENVDREIESVFARRRRVRCHDVGGEFNVLEHDFELCCEPWSAFYEGRRERQLGFLGEIEGFKGLAVFEFEKHAPLGIERGGFVEEQSFR